MVIILKKLLINGEKSFNEIIKQINNAKKSIVIQMFIWRDDSIGNLLLKHLYDAMERGVIVTINKDTYGTIFEKSEENRQSLFSKNRTFKITSWLMFYLIYFKKESPKFIKQNKNELLDKSLMHNNLNLELKLLKDHTKYYLFDDEILITGGINIEDKEMDKDFQNRKYHDYMIMTNETKIIETFKSRINNLTSFNYDNGIDFIISNRKNKEALLVVLKLINDSKDHIKLTMAYFGNKKITNALINASKRGVKIEIITSEKSNTQQDLNMKTLKKLFKNNIKIYLYHGLVHAKVLLIDQYIVLGSINLNNGSLTKLGECSIYLNDKSIIEEYVSNFELMKKESKNTMLKSFKYNKIKGLLEQIFS